MYNQITPAHGNQTQQVRQRCLFLSDDTAKQTLNRDQLGWPPTTGPGSFPKAGHCPPPKPNLTVHNCVKHSESLEFKTPHDA